MTEYVTEDPPDVCKENCNITQQTFQEKLQISKITGIFTNLVIDNSVGATINQEDCIQILEVLLQGQKTDLVSGMKSWNLDRHKNG